MGTVKNKLIFFNFSMFFYWFHLYLTQYKKKASDQILWDLNIVFSFIAETMEYNGKIKEQKKLLHFSIFFINFIFNWFSTRIKQACEAMVSWVHLNMNIRMIFCSTNSTQHSSICLFSSPRRKHSRNRIFRLNPSKSLILKN